MRFVGAEEKHKIESQYPLSGYLNQGSLESEAPNYEIR